MGRLSLLSAALFIVPVAITIGVLVGYESFQTSRGQVGLGPRPNNAITLSTYCQKAYGFQPPDSQFVLNPNQWGTDTIGPGSALCLNVTSFDNGTYATNDTAPAFTATWEYPVGPVTEPVHAYPNAKLDVPAIPAELADISSLMIDMKWSYGLGGQAAETTDQHALNVNLLNANVCIDSFLDSNQDQAGITNVSSYEVMIWFGRFGPATQPIGNLNGPLLTESVGATAFDLFYGSNSIGQKVFTWVAQGNTTEFTGDVQVLFSSLADHGGPVSTDYLGYVAFGSEALSSAAEVTFSVPRLAMNISTIQQSRV